jgi:ADP-ribosylglycohydrolase
MREEFKYMILAHTLGDIMGLPYEYFSNFEKNVKDGMNRDEVDFGKFYPVYTEDNKKLPAFKWSDDTEVSMHLLSVLIKYKFIIEDVEKVHNEIKNAYIDLIRDVKKDREKHYGYGKTFIRIDEPDFEPDITNDTNNTLMRAYPYAFIKDATKCKELLIRDIRLTNANKNVEYCCLLYIARLRENLYGRIDIIDDRERYVLKEINALYGIEDWYFKNGGHEEPMVIEELNKRSAIYCISFITYVQTMKGKGVKKTYSKIITSRKDSDTNAAICGPLIYLENRKEFENDSDIKYICDRIMKIDGDYTPARMISLMYRDSKKSITIYI